LTTKSCDLKGSQKIFRLHLNDAASCCRSYFEKLDETKTIDHYIDHWQQEKVLLDQGQEIPSCEVCWKNEHAGLSSYRQQRQGKSHAGHPNKPPRADQIFNGLEILTSDLCNQMCSYCNPKYSSEWRNSITKDGIFTNVSTTTKNNQTLDRNNSFNQTYWLAEIQRYISNQPDNSIELKLLGGEPLMQIDGLKQLLELNSSKIDFLAIHTNLNPPTQKFLRWILENFPKEKLLFDISIDSTPEYNHVPRSGFDQDRFLNNLSLLKEHDVSFKFTPVISILSIFDVVNFCSMIDKNGYSAVFSQVNNPDCLNPIHLPWEFKTRILNTHVPLPNLVKEILTTHTKSVDLKLFEQYNYLKQYFARTEIDPACTPNALFNEYWTWLSNQGFL
jgi:sulfatase maturation enzyme AslB (radical SAM superfamily)